MCDDMEAPTDGDGDDPLTVASRFLFEQWRISARGALRVGRARLGEVVMATQALADWAQAEFSDAMYRSLEAEKDGDDWKGGRANDRAG